mmetsp:Transcript_54077/g.107424  ORF Transcript_54077/g.107424 Transcript_54077/m.107424 type:complete len:213 (+) Transcript_54077:409-1047(+)
MADPAAVLRVARLAVKFVEGLFEGDSAVCGGGGGECPEEEIIHREVLGIVRCRYALGCVKPLTGRGHRVVVSDPPWQHSKPLLKIERHGTVCIVITVACGTLSALLLTKLNVGESSLGGQCESGGTETGLDGTFPAFMDLLSLPLHLIVCLFSSVILCLIRCCCWICLLRGQRAMRLRRSIALTPQCMLVHGCPRSINTHMPLFHWCSHARP